MSEEDQSQKSGRVRSGQARMNKLSPEERRALAKAAAKARWEQREVDTQMSNEDNKLSRKADPKVDTQMSLLVIEKQIEVDGVGMGVLTNGVPFLTARGLSRLCGVTVNAILGMSEEWADNPPKDRVASIKRILLQNGIVLENPYIEIVQRNGSVFAYPESICVAVLEYYAFEAGPNIKEHAQKNFRLLVRKGLKDFIYAQLGYDPERLVPDVWKHFHDRVSLTYNSVPNGYFSVFKEIADMIVTLIQGGAPIDNKFIPDISVGRIWARYWDMNKLELRFQSRQKYDHEYPDYFPQSESNPQEAWCYPEEALGEFRRWFREIYIGGGKFAKYLNDKQRQLPASFAQLALKAYGQSLPGDPHAMIEPDNMRDARGWRRTEEPADDISKKGQGDSTRSTDLSKILREKNEKPND